jgi:hypothetical protein
VSLGAPDVRLTGWTTSETVEQSTPADASGLAEDRDATRDEVASTTLSN